MSMISGTANWMSDDGKPKTKKKEESVKTQSELTDAKKLKMLDSLLKKVIALESEVDTAYRIWPTSEMSTVSTLIHSIRFNIKKIKPTNE